MKPSRLAQKLHKWLGLLVGLQLIIWTMTGFYMVVVDIDIIHGDHLVSESHQPAVVLDAGSLPSPLFADLVEANPAAHVITLTSMMGKLVYRVDSDRETLLFDALSGELLPPLALAEVQRLALTYYSGTADIRKTTLIKDNPPTEIGGRPLPLWRVDFDDLWGASFYISPQTGALVTRRHTLWRVFDFAWMLHIMDYDERENVNNLVLRIISGLALLSVLSGIWYLYFRLNLRRRFRRATP